MPDMAILLTNSWAANAAHTGIALARTQLWLTQKPRCCLPPADSWFFNPIGAVGSFTLKHGNGHFERNFRKGDFFSSITCQCQDSDRVGETIGSDVDNSKDPLLEVKSVASKKLQDYLDNYKSCGGKLEDWEQWQQFFREAEEKENLISAMEVILEDAIRNEDFQEAARLKAAIEAARSNDVVAQVLQLLKGALEEERYGDAARLRDEAGAGLVGWWSGLSEKDPYGRIINIKPAYCRLIAESYTPRQLAVGAPGVPLFELFVQKKDEEEYETQAVYLKRDQPEADPSKKIKKVLDAVIARKVSNEDKVEGSDDDTGKKEDSHEEREKVNDLINFLKERVPDLKLKVVKVSGPDIREDDIPKIIDKLIEGNVKEEDQLKVEEIVENQLEELEASIADIEKSHEREVSVRVVLGGASPTSREDISSKPAVKTPAKLEKIGKNQFLFHLESAKDIATAEESEEVAKISAISADLMPGDVAKVLRKAEKPSRKGTKGLGDIIRLALNQSERRHDLRRRTKFERLEVSGGNTDVFSGLYIGAYGANTPEVVKLTRKYGRWGDHAPPSNVKTENYDYVEAVKLTGDFNVPAGQVTFRSKIGKENRLSPLGFYPDELGVVARYKGQGRLAEPGFQNPGWVDGELLVLDGKGSSYTNGAELGFVYTVSERHFLILFSRLKLT